MRTGKWTVSSRWHVERIARMFGSRWSLSAAMVNCSSAISHGSRWVWSMTAAVFTKPSVSWRSLELLDDEPVVRRPARRVEAVPVLEHDAAESLREQGLAPRAQRPRHVRREAHVPRGREHPFEMPTPLEQRDP